MYKAFNRPIFYQKMEKPFLTFAQEVTYYGDTVCLIVSVSADTWYDKETRLGIPAKRSWLGNNAFQINIPRSVSAIAYSLPKTGGVPKVFAFVGNNDDDYPDWYYPNDLSELQSYYWQDGDVTSRQIIRFLKRAGYDMWHPQLNSRLGTRLNNKEKRPDHVYNWPIHWPVLADILAGTLADILTVPPVDILANGLVDTLAPALADILLGDILAHILPDISADTLADIIARTFAGIFTGPLVDILAGSSADTWGVTLADILADTLVDILAYGDRPIYRSTVDYQQQQQQQQ